MAGTSAQRATVNIRESALKHKLIVPHLLAAHALTGCDTVGCLYGIGKVTVVKALSKGMKLDAIGNTQSSIDLVLAQASSFLAVCYGSKKSVSMSDLRYEIWLSKTGKAGATRIPKFQSLPPTAEAMVENIKRAHFQACIWKEALNEDPPDLDPTQYGWSKDESTKSLTPVMLPDGTAPAPHKILEMICCRCTSDRPCEKKRCGCHKSQLSCTVFCKCHTSEQCFNSWTKKSQEYNNEEENDDTEDST